MYRLLFFYVNMIVNKNNEVLNKVKLKLKLKLSSKVYYMINQVFKSLITSWSIMSEVEKERNEAKNRTSKWCNP